MGCTDPGLDDYGGVLMMAVGEIIKWIVIGYAVLSLVLVVLAVLLSGLLGEPDNFLQEWDELAKGLGKDVDTQG